MNQSHFFKRTSVFIVCALVAILFVACGKPAKNSTPDETVLSFFAALEAGDLNKAESLMQSDTATNEKYSEDDSKLVRLLMKNSKIEILSSSVFKNETEEEGADGNEAIVEVKITSKNNEELTLLLNEAVNANLTEIAKMDPKKQADFVLKTVEESLSKINATSENVIAFTLTKDANGWKIQSEGGLNEALFGLGLLIGF